MAEHSGPSGRHDAEPPLRFSQKLNHWLEREKVQSVECVRLVLVGKTGVGKSATGNTIMGKKDFLSKLCVKSVTTKCKKKTATVSDRMVQVIDTPGLFDTTFPNEDIRQEIAKCIIMSSPGPHVFLLLLSIGRFTDEERETVRIIQETFGENSKAYTMVGFTRGEEIFDEGTSLKQYLKDSPPALRELVEECGGRTHVFCNKNQATWGQQVQSLLDKIDAMIQQNGGSFYTTAMYEETEAKIRAREMRLLQQKLQELENINRDENVSFLANELSKVRLTLEKKFKNLRDEALRDRDEEIKKLEELRAELEKNHDKKINEIDEKVFRELARSRRSIRRQAEEAEADAIAKTSKHKKDKCVIC